MQINIVNCFNFFYFLKLSIKYLQNINIILVLLSLFNNHFAKAINLFHNLVIFLCNFIVFFKIHFKGYQIQ
jgi:hypothetical protein